MSLDHAITGSVAQGLESADPMTPPPLADCGTIVGRLTAQASRHPNRLALAVAPRRFRRGQYQELTFSNLEEDSTLCAHVLAGQGIGSRMRTVVMIPPGRAFCAVVFGLLKLGAVPVFIDPRIGRRSVEHCFTRARPEAFVGIGRARLARRLFGWGRDSIHISIPAPPMRSPVGSVDARSRRLPQSDAGPDSSDMAAIAFTSGSTGPPKGVVLTHAQLLAQATLLNELLGAQAGARHLATFPLFLLFGPVLGLETVVPEMDMSRPATAVPEALVTAIDRYQCESMFGSPVLIRKLGAYCGATGHTLHSMRRVLSAGAPSDPRALATLARAIPSDGQICTPYGATEALPVSNASGSEILPDAGEPTRPEEGVCVGRPLRGLTVRIIRIDDGAIPDWSEVEPLPEGQIGEIAVAGPVVSPRYVNDPEATALAKIAWRDRGSFFHRMGDVGYLDDQGRLWMCGRKSQRVAGRTRVYFTVPCERVFNRHERVSRTALVGVAGPSGTVPVMCVELRGRPSARERAEILDELRRIAAGCDHTRDITQFLVYPEFPVDSRHNSKIRRETLAEWAARQLAVSAMKAHHG